MMSDTEPSNINSLLSPDLTLIILHISLRNLRVFGSIGPRTSMHIGKNSIEGRGFPYFFIFSSAALAAVKPHSLLVRAVRRAPSNSPNLEGSMCLDVRRKYINLGKLRALRIIVKASWAERQKTRPRANLSSESFCQRVTAAFFILTTLTVIFGSPRGYFSKDSTDKNPTLLDKTDSDMDGVPELIETGSENGDGDVSYQGKDHMKKRFSEFLGGKRSDKRFSEFLGGRK
ncbi:hypothetical protein HELRODRAFT_169864 [Helobdella robusta]|uniref:Uncharacterized protein n=1 Tax=Helobdella robusta TaxID=6412 RepID=T1F2E1_HELRO|nr:hypothetical protein HELRODRAFT_169864 [Helobdella robusta]ESO08128.1 hypothetical protein HELRODRAFT_169864 [Helobdella robusta]